MPTPVYGDTFGEIKIAILRAVGDLVATGTADAGGASTLDDAVLLAATDAPYLGAYIYLYDGPGQGDARDITAFAAATDRVTVVPAFSATPTTATKYFICRRFHPLDLQEAIRRSLMRLGKHAKDYVDQSLIGGSPVVNGTFYDNTGTFPNGWTRVGATATFTRATTVSKHGRFSCEIAAALNEAAGLTQTIPNIGRYRGRSMEFKGWVWTTAASRVSIAISDGITTQTSTAISSTNRGWGTEELTSGSLAISDRATAITLSCDISSGAAITARFAGMWLPANIWEWALPAGSPTLIHQIRYESNDDFRNDISMADLELVEEGTRRLRLLRSYPSGRIIEVQGRTSWLDFATQGTDDDTTFDGDPDWLINQAAAYLLRDKGDNRGQDFQRMAGEPSATALPMNSMLIERN